MARLSTLESFGAISTSLLPSRLTRVSSLISFFCAAIVHPVEIGRREHVGRRALLDLLHQRRARRVARNDFDAGRLQKRRVDVVERILHRCRDEYGDGLVLRHGAVARQAETKNNRAGRACRRKIMAALHPARARSHEPGSLEITAAREPPFRAQARAQRAVCRACILTIRPTGSNRNSRCMLSRATPMRLKLTWRGRACRRPRK